jgi:hypothetical protein
MQPRLTGAQGLFSAPPRAPGAVLLIALLGGCSDGEGLPPVAAPRRLVPRGTAGGAGRGGKRSGHLDDVADRRAADRPADERPPFPHGITADASRKQRRDFQRATERRSPLRPAPRRSIAASRRVLVALLVPLGDSASIRLFARRRPWSPGRPSGSARVGCPAVERASPAAFEGRTPRRPTGRAGCSLLAGSRLVGRGFSLLEAQRPQPRSHAGDHWVQRLGACHDEVAG